jgi:hypothetical protein
MNKINIHSENCCPVSTYASKDHERYIKGCWMLSPSYLYAVFPYVCLSVPIIHQSRSPNLTNSLVSCHAKFPCMKQVCRMKPFFFWYKTHKFHMPLHANLIQLFRIWLMRPGTASTAYPLYSTLTPVPQLLKRLLGQIQTLPLTLKPWGTLLQPRHSTPS